MIRSVYDETTLDVKDIRRATVVSISVMDSNRMEVQSG
jgi:hypothetical protein